MDQQARDDRLVAELESLRGLKKASSIFDFECQGDPPDHYTVTFRGRGVTRSTSSRADTEFVDLHKVEVRLPYSYPDRPPDVRWVTPLFHPNVSFSGFINFKDIGLDWANDLGMDALCERLWDVARFDYIDLSRATNYAAKNWFEEDATLPLPCDRRRIRDLERPGGANVVRYERRGGRRAPAVEPSGDVLFIGEDTPTPPPPPTRSDGRRVTPRRRPPNDDDVLYIGDD